MNLTYSIRPWQADALSAFSNHPHKDFLCVATPGAGKTTFALIAARQVLAQRDDITRIVVVVPSAHLREQWADAAAGLGLILIHISTMYRRTATGVSPHITELLVNLRLSRVMRIQRLSSSTKFTMLETKTHGVAR